MKWLYSSDLHGEVYLYQELFEWAQSSSAEIIALGGDLFPSFPPTKRYEDMIPTQKAFIDQFLLPFFKRTLAETDVTHLFLIPGNWDIVYPYLFKEPVEGMIDLDRKIFRLKNGYEIIGYPFVPPTPFRPKDYEKMDDLDAAWPPQKDPSYIRMSDWSDELNPIDPYSYLRRRETIQEDLDQLPKPLVPGRTIYLTHSPPFRTYLDRIPGGNSIGSRSLKSFIQSRQPLLTLHGHIHESPQFSGCYFDWIGNTLSLNPGQFTSKKLHAVTFEIEDIKKTLKHSFLPDHSDILNEWKGRRARVRSSTILGKSQGGDSGPDDFFGHECQRDGQTIEDDSREGRDFANRIKKGEKGGREDVSFCSPSKKGEPTKTSPFSEVSFFGGILKNLSKLLYKPF